MLPQHGQSRSRNRSCFSHHDIGTFLRQAKRQICSRNLITMCVTHVSPVDHAGGKLPWHRRTDDNQIALTLPLSSGTFITSPLTVYTIPCNASFAGMTTGIGRCPDHLSVSVPLSTPATMQFVPWATVMTNDTHSVFGHPALDIPAPSFLNRTVLADLDSTFKTLDGDLSATTSAADHEINDITAISTTSTTSYVAYSALGLSLLSCFSWFIVCYFSFSRHAAPTNALRSKVCRCRRKRTKAGTDDTLSRSESQCVRPDTSARPSKN